MYWSLVVLTGVLLLHNMSAHDSQPVSFCPDVLICGCTDRCVAATQRVSTWLPTCVFPPWCTDLWLYWQVCCCYTTCQHMTPNLCLSALMYWSLVVMTDVLLLQNILVHDSQPVSLCPGILISCIDRCVAATQHIGTWLPTGVSALMYWSLVVLPGVLLLHNISIQDPNYQQSHSVVHLHYSTLMSGLTPIYRRLKSQEALPQEEGLHLRD